MRLKSKEPPITKAQRYLWDELNTTIRECGAWTVSQPDVFPVRFECEMDSPLPAFLAEVGHSVRHLGTHERLMPAVETIAEHGSTRKVVRQHVAPGVAAVYELSLIMNAEKAKD